MARVGPDGDEPARALARLGGNTAKMLAGTAGNQIAGIVMLPLLTRLLSKSEIGLWDLVQFSFSLGPLLIGLEVPTIAGMRISSNAGAPLRQGELFSAALKFTGTVSLAIVVLYFIFGESIAAHWLPGLGPLGLLIIPIAVIVATALGHVVTLAQHAGFVGWGSATNLVALLINIAAATALVVLADAGVTGLIVAKLISGAIGTVLILYLARRLIHKGRSLSVLPGILRSSIPLMPYAAAFFILLYGDRVILNRYVSLDEIGVYSIAFRVSMMGFALLSAITAAYVFEFYRMDQGDRLHSPVLKQLTHRCAIGIAAVILCVVEFAPEGLRLLAPSGYGRAADLIPWLLIGQGCFGILSLLWLELIAREKTVFVGLVTVVAAAINLGLNMALVPTRGILGAAIAQLAAYSLLLSASVYYLHRKRLLVSGGVGALAALLLVSVVIGMDRGLLRLGLVPRIGVVSLVIAVLLYIGLRSDQGAVFAASGFRARSRQNDRPR